MREITIRQFADRMGFNLLSGEKGLDRCIEDEMINSPGMEFAGFFDYFIPKRVILVGSKEATFLKKVSKTKVGKVPERIKYICEQNPPCFVFSANVVTEHQDVIDEVLKIVKEFDIPVFTSELRTTAISSKMYSYLQERLAPRLSQHGVLMDINGMGTLIIGKSGIGKSETALDLIKRGHQLVGDDRVDIFEKEVGTLIGSAPKVLEKFMEIRGIGIVNIVQMFGAGAYRDNKKIRLVVELEKWEEGKNYDRLGLDNLTQKFFNTDVTKIVIPVLPGRNVALLVESAAMNIKLKHMGYNGAKEFTDKIDELARGGKL